MAKKETGIVKTNTGRSVKKEIENTPESMIAAAIAKGLPVETMEKLMAMRRELEQEKAKKEFFVSLAQFQGDCPEITKDKSVKYESKRGGKVGYSYADIGTIVGTIKYCLRTNGFSYTIETIQTDKAVKAICIVHHAGGFSKATEFEIPIDPEAYMNAAQKVASALTYAKRYALCNAFGLVTVDEDDDAVSVVIAETTMPRKTVDTKQPPPTKPQEQPKEKTAREVLRAVAAILTDDVFTDEERKKAKLELTKLAGENNVPGLVALGESWLAVKKQREQETEILAEQGFKKINNTLDGAIGEDNE